MDEYLLSKLITNWRKEVWDQAFVLLGTSTDDKREVLRIKLEKSVLQRDDLISLDYF